MAYKILMYSHDTYGLGHIRRTLTIANALNRDNTDILIITGSPLAGQFQFPRGMDYVRIPGMIKMAQDLYQPLGLGLAPEQVLAVRKEIILSVVKSFEPDLFIVDKAPLGLKKEIVPSLAWIRGHLPQTRTVLGLRDVMDDAGTVQAHWRRNHVFSVLEESYDHIWVYGNQDIYDPVVEYGIPSAIAQKICFTGYLERRTGSRTGRVNGTKQLLVTAGGGKDGFPLFDAFLDWYGSERPDGVSASLVLGPFLGEAEQARLGRRAETLKIPMNRYCPDMEAMIGSADLLVCMGGYNTLCEAMSSAVPALIVPRDRPRREQLIRAQRLAARGLVAYIPPQDLTPGHLGQTIEAMLEQIPLWQQAMAGFEMSGVRKILEQVTQIRGATAP